jgi:ribosomal protein S27E
MGDERRRKDHVEAVEVVCPRCNHTEIVYIPKEPIPQCPRCKRRMIVKEILTEGKSY